MQKLLKVPASFVSGHCTTTSLQLDGCSVLENCAHTYGDSGTMFFEEHVLVMVLSGETIYKGAQWNLTLHQGEMALMRKFTSVEYTRAGADKDQVFDCVMLCVKDTFIKDFFEAGSVSIPPTTEEMPVLVHPMGPSIKAFCRSLKPAFDDPAAITENALRERINGLFADVREHNRRLFLQLVQLVHPAKADLRRVVEESCFLPVTLDDLAYLCGMSTSTFNRDFRKEFGMPPARWLREHRLEKARQLLADKANSVTDVCYRLGYENPSHFSRAFKAYFGFNPSETVKNQ